MRRAVAVGLAFLLPAAWGSVAWGCVGDDAASMSPGVSPPDAGNDSAPSETGTPVDGSTDAAIDSDACAAGGCAATVATGQKQPQAVAVNGSFVYWISTGAGAAGEGAILRCPITGCVGDAQVIRGALTAPLALAVDDVALYFSAGTPGGVFVTQCAKDGCLAPIDLATAEGEVPALVIAESKLFFARGAPAPNGGAAMCTPGTAASCTYVLTGINSVEGLAVTLTHFFYGELVRNGGVVQAFNRAGNSATELAANQGTPHAIRVDGGYVYWLNAGAVMRAAAGDFVGPAQKVAPAGNPRDLAVDATNVYFTNRDDGTVAKCPISGCQTPTILATGQKGPEGIVVDATHVYWAVKGTGASDGAIMRLAK